MFIYIIPLENSQLVAMSNDTCVEYSMTSQVYEVVGTNSHEVSGWTIISGLLHSLDPNLGGTNGDVQPDLSTMALNNIK